MTVQESPYSFFSVLKKEYNFWLFLPISKEGANNWQETNCPGNKTMRGIQLASRFLSGSISAATNAVTSALSLTQPGDLVGMRGAKNKLRILDEEGRLKAGHGGDLFVEKLLADPIEVVRSVAVYASTDGSAGRQYRQDVSPAALNRGGDASDEIAAVIIRRKADSCQLAWILANLADHIPAGDADDRDNIYGVQAGIGPSAQQHLEPAVLVTGNSTEDLQAKLELAYHSLVSERVVVTE
ncbi:MAG: hypothetical protein ACI9BD_001163 [Candidatus Marinamargulisbacteria bacterium]|jgi:hypothetical protein